MVKSNEGRMSIYGVHIPPNDRHQISGVVEMIGKEEKLQEKKNTRSLETSISPNQKSPTDTLRNHLNTYMEKM